MNDLAKFEDENAEDIAHAYVATPGAPTRYVAKRKQVVEDAIRLKAEGRPVLLEMLMSLIKQEHDATLTVDPDSERVRRDRPESMTELTESLGNPEQSAFVAEHSLKYARRQGAHIHLFHTRRILIFVL